MWSVPRWLFWSLVLALGGAPTQAGDEMTVLSEHGSGRATAYPPTNKVVTLGERTHVTWLDSEEEGFQVRIRTLDRRTGEWTPTVTVGPAQDNHGGAALAADPQGYLHLWYYPHHDAMRYRRSLRPNDASAWGSEEQFGQDLTYPVAMIAADGTLLMTARRSYDEKLAFTPPAGSAPWETELWRRRPQGEWERVGPVLRARFPGYAQFAEAFWWGSDGRTLHLACRIYETDRENGNQLFNTIGYLVSPDSGETWHRHDGTRVELPATSETIDRIAIGGTAQASVLVSGGLIVDARDQPQVLYSEFGPNGAVTYLASPDDETGWDRRPLMRELPDPWADWEVIVPGAITRTASGRWIVAATLQRVPSGDSWWAHPSDEVAQLWSDDGGQTFEFEVFGPIDPTRPRWLPNLERATGHHAVPDRAGLLYTDGEAGANNADILRNRVIFRKGGAAE